MTRSKQQQQQRNSNHWNQKVNMAPSRPSHVLANGPVPFACVTPKQACTIYNNIFTFYSGETLDYLELPDNEAAFSVALAPFPTYQQQMLIKQQQQLNSQMTNLALQEQFLVVGTAKDMTLYPRKSSNGGFMHVYRIVSSAQSKWSLQLVHKTPVEDVPYALCAFQGRLLVGIRNILRIYDMGKKKMLRKCENKNLPNFIVSIHTHQERIYVGDITESFHFIKYRKVYIHFVYLLIFSMTTC